MDKNKLIIIGAAAAFLVIAVCMFIPEKKTEEKPAQKPKNETPDIPDGDTQQVSTSKKEGYERGTARNRNSAADIYWNGQDEIKITHEEVRQSSEEMFGRGTQATTPTYSTPPPSNPYRETAEEREARHRRRQEEAIELAEADALEAALSLLLCPHPASPAAAPSAEMPASCRNLRLEMLLSMPLTLLQKS
jgi:hypothetical protein